MVISCYAFNVLLILRRRGCAYTSNLDTRSKPKSDGSESDPASAGSSFFAVVFALLLSPQRLLFLWNWKSALLSLILRGPIFLVATFHRGWRSAVAALLTESIFCVLTAGFYGAIVQSLRDARPEWLTAVFLTVVMPAIFQVLEYWLHLSRGTPHLIPAEIISVAVSAISALFNWYAMRRGTLLVGAEGKAFGSDLRRLPRLILGFLTVLPGKLLEYVKRAQSAMPGRGECL